mgnify:CR=1 FL=1
MDIHCIVSKLCELDTSPFFTEDTRIKHLRTSVSPRGRLCDSEPENVVAMVVVAAAVVALWVWRKPHRTVPAIARLGGWAWRLFAQLSLRAKLKQMLSFYQVATAMPMISGTTTLPSQTRHTDSSGS